jgi:transcriptional regulator with GAF, ATPase, and Fis domain
LARVYELHHAVVMARQVLIAAPARTARKLSDVVGDQFEVVTCSEPEQAMALAATGTFLAIVKTVGFANLTTDTPIIHIDDATGSQFIAELTAIRVRARLDQRARASELAYLAALPYDEYVAAARARTTRDYLLALLRRHDGVVAEAARAAGLLRETLHRLIRRHDIDPDWFRDEPE